VSTGPPPDYALATLEDHVGRELGVSDWVTVDQSTIDRFADVTGDHQWIHVDAERARRESPYGGTIAHGFLTLSLLPAMRNEVGVIPAGVERTINYGLDRVRFMEAVPAGARIRCRIELTGVEPKGDGVLMRTRNTIELEGSERPAAVVDAVTLLLRG
jgi:acyl dehydratase